MFISLVDLFKLFCGDFVKDLSHTPDVYVIILHVVQITQGGFYMKAVFNLGCFIN